MNDTQNTDRIRQRTLDMVCAAIASMTKADLNKAHGAVTNRLNVIFAEERLVAAHQAQAAFRDTIAKFDAMDLNRLAGPDPSCKRCGGAGYALMEKQACQECWKASA